MVAEEGAARQRHSQLVLIVEDDEDIADLLADYFEMKGYEALVAPDAASALETRKRNPDIILLDVNLPDGDGFKVCRTIRQSTACPIVFLTARTEDADAIAGFAAGGDDYVTKPFSLEVLGARVQAHLARSVRPTDRAVVRFSGGIAIDFGARTVHVDTLPVELARKDFDIVALLAKRPGQVFDRSMVYDLVWEEPGDPSVVTEHIRRIRRAFSQAGCEINPIATSWGVGYSWQA